MAFRWPDVTVVVPHYNAADALARVVEAVRAQDYAGAVEIVVADDGSDTPPELDGVRVVRQADEGFRAAAARNLGAEAARGEILAFLDADTVPEPGYLSAVVPHIVGDARAVVVGARRTGAGDAEPQWLADAWAATDNLRNADHASWRYVISAVLTCSREFFDTVGGFDATFVGYGGEDWEFGFRAWNAGATLVHEPAAVAHHPEEDFGARYDDPEKATAVKNAETLALARRVTHPLARPDGIVFDTFDMQVEVPELDGEGVRDFVIAEWLKVGAYVRVAQVPALFAHDPRVGTDEVDARVNIAVGAGWAPQDLDALLAVEYVLCPDGTVVRTARAAALGLEPATAHPADIGMTPVTGPLQLERYFAGW
ncbi:glycosyltransferase family 2 protein [Corynebacterium fournieri]|uniref:glycosyltransferase family 2 protein n=1 Tax=Corynebacterium fournieri TaxID=1852390 RepID=UPI0025B4278A|nr:glycosyltransferase [Corynebacterium fournieri]WJY98157.1 Chondroitin synthase [Corynebacterium fournieri]